MPTTPTHTRRRRLPRPPALRRRGDSEPAASATTTATPTSRPVDTVALRVRAAGGPLDAASYACSCGAVFQAVVSTTVSCPHCGAAQAW